MLEVKNLRKEFGNLVAIDDLTFSIDEQDIRAVIGPNGAGKTTFFNLLTGALSPDEGSIVFKGEDIVKKSIPEIARMGMVRKYQTASIYQELTVEENFRVAVDPSRISDPKKSIQNAVEQVQLEDKLQERAGSLSHGSKQWLEIGMILATEPELLLLDEPTAGMTAKETRRTAELIRKINKKEDVSTIIIEHDIDFVRQLQTQVTVLHQGSVLTEGSIEEIEQNTEVQEVYLGVE